MLILGDYCQFIIGVFLLLLVVYNKVTKRMSEVRDLERTPNTGGNPAYIVTGWLWTKQIKRPRTLYDGFGMAA